MNLALQCVSQRLASVGIALAFDALARTLALIRWMD